MSFATNWGSQTQRPSATKQWPGDSVDRIVVTVVEPQDSARVRFKPAPLDSTHPHSGWKSAVAIVQRNPMAVQAALQRFPEWRTRGLSAALAEWPVSDSGAVLTYWQFMVRHASPGDFRTAVSVLASSPDYRNRVVAVSILANFVDGDAALWALVDALRESDGMVKAMAGQVLDLATRGPRRRVDWKPVAPAIHAMLDGTSLAESMTLMRLLVATDVQPELAAPLLRDGGRILLAYAGAEHRYTRQTAHNLLAALKGQDFGSDVARWRDWIASL
ncbi:MAG: hypothetical protein M3Z54_03175 [Gemmatimonadota bacterium]|nr:hypothetical protein [Gemmatimonadota bacterium]